MTVYDIIVMSFEKDIYYGLLVKGLTRAPLKRICTGSNPVQTTI